MTSPTDNRAPTTGNGAAPTTSSKRRNRIFRILLSMGALLFSFAVAEGALRLLERSQLGDRGIDDKLITDPNLGSKLAPFAHGHDANGFRNDSVPQHSDIVVLGDSQSWGVNAERPQAWPQQLSNLSGRSVYNMSMGGFGPVQYNFLLPEALRLSPKVVVVAFYLGNDIYDAYHMAHHYDAHRNLRSNTAGDLSVDTVGQKATLLWNQEKQFHHTFGRDSLSGMSFWLREHLAIGRLLNRTHLWPGAQDVDYEIDKRWVLAHPDHGAICEWPGRETVFTTAYRLAGLDLDEPRIREGLRISKDLLRRMRSETEGKNVKFLALLVPTKETVYANAQSSKLTLNPTYQKLVDMEQEARSQIISTCQEQNIRCVDLLPYLVKSLDAGERLYPSTTESHPNPRGYTVIASAAHENIVKLY